VAGDRKRIAEALVICGRVVHKRDAFALCGRLVTDLHIVLGLLQPAVGDRSPQLLASAVTPAGNDGVAHCDRRSRTLQVILNGPVGEPQTVQMHQGCTRRVLQFRTARAGRDPGHVLKHFASAIEIARIAGHIHAEPRCCRHDPGSFCITCGHVLVHYPPVQDERVFTLANPDASVQHLAEHHEKNSVGFSLFSSGGHQASPLLDDPGAECLVRGVAIGNLPPCRFPLEPTIFGDPGQLKRHGKIYQPVRTPSHSDPPSEPSVT
jgi:hypothetical protein